MEESIMYGEKHIETKLSSIGAKVSKAIEMTHTAGQLLIDVQTEIAGLYESLGDVLAGLQNEVRLGNPNSPNSQEAPGSQSTPGSQSIPESQDAPLGPEKPDSPEA